MVTREDAGDYIPRILRIVRHLISDAEAQCLLLGTRTVAPIFIVSRTLLYLSRPLWLIIFLDSVQHSYQGPVDAYRNPPHFFLRRIHIKSMLRDLAASTPLQFFFYSLACDLAHGSFMFFYKLYTTGPADDRLCSGIAFRCFESKS